LLNRSIIIGTRGSLLALWQARKVIELLKAIFPDQAVELLTICTEGDQRPDALLAHMGGRGVFVKEIEHALLRGDIDCAVHSLKDLPSTIPDGLVLTAVPKREDPRDVLVSKHGSISALPAGARIGTSSPRRMAQLLSIRPDLQIVPLRGNLDTRIRKALEGDLDGAVLAAAGMIRLGKSGSIAQFLPLDTFVPAAGQGALVVEARADDVGLLDMLAKIDHPDSSRAARAERAFLAAIGGGCQTPVAALAEASDHIIRLRAMLAPVSGGVPRWDNLDGPSSDPEGLGQALAARLLDGLQTGRIYLVGAGPGDPGLITVRGQELLREAQVVVYDRLVDNSLLAQVQPSAELIFVGKAASQHTMTQSEINALLVERGRAGKLVVRLKGGDPFVFGRGGEEAAALHNAGIRFEVVPGVTSAIAAPAYAGIPVTQRGVAVSFTVITGHEDPTKSQSQIDWSHLPDGTLVFLMGAENLAHIVAQLVRHGRPPETPAAFIHKGTTPAQQTITGTLAGIAGQVADSGLGPPAILVAGPVVNLRDTLSWFENRPLFGKRVLVTRSREQASVLSALLRQGGAIPYELPVVAIRPAVNQELLDAAISRLPGGYDWVAFTSANGVHIFWERLRAAGKDARSIPLVCAIGPATAAALSGYGIITDLQPTEFIAEALVRSLQQRGIAGQRVLLPRASGARPVLANGLRQLGATVDEVATYTAELPATSGPKAADVLADGIDVITFTSSSTVQHLMRLLDYDVGRLAGVKIAAIGPITAHTACSLGLAVHIEATEYTIPGLVRALERYYAP
jgi:uroporphyrinogen III methyltransferase/synthase